MTRLTEFQRLFDNQSVSAQIVAGYGEEAKIARTIGTLFKVGSMVGLVSVMNNVVSTALNPVMAVGLGAFLGAMYLAGADRQAEGTATVIARNELEAIDAVDVNTERGGKLKRTLRFLNPLKY